MKILITGAGGYVGIPLCELLAKQGHEVRPIDRWFFGIDKVKKVGLSYSHIENIDIRNMPVSAFENIDCVIDLAGLSNDASCDIDIDLTLSINCEGGVNLARLAKQAGVKRYIYSSSCAVYGDGSGQTNLTEISPTNPLTQYAKCKKSVEDELLSLNDENFEVIILRNSTIFGVAPRMRFDLAVNIMTARAWKDKVIYVMGGGEQWRPFIHVQDVCRAFEFMLTNGQAGDIYNVGGQNITIRQLARLVLSELKDVEVHNIPDDPDQRSYNVNFDKIKSIGFSSQKTVIDGIREVKEALIFNDVSLDDPTTHTLNWYKLMLSWEKRINDLSINGKIL